MAVEFGLARGTARELTNVDRGDVTVTQAMNRYGRCVDSQWRLITKGAPAALSSTDKVINGVALTSDNCVYITNEEPATKSYTAGIVTRTDGVIWATTSPVSPLRQIYHPLLEFVLIDGAGALYVTVGEFNPSVPDFYAPMTDGGAGTAVLTPTIGTGTPTFTRATAAACRLSTGLWKLDIASGVPRAHYHEFTSGSPVYGGYLCEAAATQLALDPRDMTQASWVKGATMTVAQTGTGITGAANSCSRLTAGAVAGTNTVMQTLTAAASSRTYSCFIKRVTGTGTVTISQGATTLDVTALINTSNFVQVSLNASVLNVAFGITMNTNTDVILVDCNQFEAGAVATTPIPAAGTRNADVLTYTSADMQTGSGTCYADCSMLSSGTGARAFVDGGSATTGLLLGLSSGDVATEISMDDNALADVTKSGLTSMLTGVRKRASAWGGTTMSITGDGAAVASGTFDGTMLANSIRIIVNPTTFMACVKEVKLWKTKATAAQLQTLTT